MREPDGEALTDKQASLEMLLSIHEHYTRLSDAPVPPPAGMFAMLENAVTTRSVATILGAQNRADRGQPGELEEHGGLVLRNTPGEWVFAADRARFPFAKGEFAAYDLTRERLARIERGDSLEPLTGAQLLLIEELFQQALADLGAAGAQPK